MTTASLIAKRPGGIPTSDLKARDLPPPACCQDAPAPNTGRTIAALQIGLRWFAKGSGGLDRVFHDLVLGLPAAGVRVQGLVIGPRDLAAATNGVVCSMGEERARLLQRLLTARRTIGDFAGSGRFDLLAPHFALHISTARGRLHNLPLVMHFHGPWADESTLEGQSAVSVAAKRLLERRIYRHADRIIVLSRAFASLLTANYGVDPDRIRVVPGGIDLRRFDIALTRRMARQSLGWPTDRPILLSVRRLTQRMGLDRMIDALAEVARIIPEVMLYIAGTGRFEPQLRKQVAERGLEQHIALLGFVPDEWLPLAYRAADINVVPSTALEGFGLTTAEALAAGTPSMVTPVGGSPEVVGQLCPDLIFASADAGDIAAGLIGALKGRIRLPDESSCRTYAATHFNTELAARRVAKTYREVV